MKEKIREYFTFTRKERLGVIVLLLIILILFIVPYWIRRPPGTEDPEATRQFAPLIEKLSRDSNETDQYRDRSSTAASLAANGRGELNPDAKRTLPARLFYFDPNLLTESEWQGLGLSDRQSRTLVHYTGKGGRFRSAEDLEKIYGLSDADRERLKPFVRIAGSPQDRTSRNSAIRRYPGEKRAGSFYPQDEQFNRGGRSHEFPPDTARGGYRKSDTYGARYTRKMPAVIDINRSDSSQWEQLPGIGEKLAARIIRFRDKLGGFYCVDQVAETFGLPDSAFQKIRPWLQADSAAIQRIDLNNVSESVLRGHPYVRWKLAAVLLRYREQHGRFQSVDDLSQIALLDAAALKRLRPYLDLSR